MTDYKLDILFSGNFITRAEVQELNESNQIKKNLKNPPLKDTVAVPDAGFTVLRFLADNVGYWLFHCHISWHNHLGMGVVIKVRFVRIEYAKYSWSGSAMHPSFNIQYANCCNYFFRLEMSKKLFSLRQKDSQPAETSLDAARQHSYMYSVIQK